jgi:uncharacterized protein YhaN
MPDGIWHNGLRLAASACAPPTRNGFATGRRTSGSPLASTWSRVTSWSVCAAVAIPAGRSSGAAIIQALQLPATSNPETAEAQINVIDDMREATGRVNDLRHERIEKIGRDIRAFERDVAALVETIAPQLGGVDAEDAALDLERLVAEAKRVRDLAAAKGSSLGGLQEKIDECHESCRDAREVIGRLQEAAGVETIDALRIAIRQSDEMRELQTEFDRITGALAEDGDGLSVAALNDECAATDLDEIAAKEQTVTQEVNELRDRLMEARENRSNARREFEAIGGDDRAARDAADRQAALAEIKEIAEQYVRLRSAVLLLQWAIDRYRREKQAPVLKCAGELFSILTGGSFQTLQLEFDEHDNVELAGIRQDGRRVAVAGMSAARWTSFISRSGSLRSRTTSAMRRRCPSSRMTCSSTSITSARRQASRF